MSAYSMVTLFKPKKENAPEGLVKAILTEHNSCYGLVIPKAGGELLVSKKDIGLSPEQVSAICKKYEDNTLVFGFGKSPTKLLEDSLQPFTLIDVNSKPILAMFIDGECSEFHKDKTQHTDQFFAFAEHIRPMVRELWESTGKQLPLLLDKFRSPVFQRNVALPLNAKGHIIFVAANGEVMLFEKGVQISRTQWGWVSDVCGYVEKKPTTTATTSTSEIDELLNVEIVEEETPAKPAEPAKTVPITTPTSVPETPKTDTAIPPGAGIAPLYPPIGLHGKNLRRWYESKMGKAPSNWKSRPGIKPVADTEPVKRFDDPRVAAAVQDGKAAPISGSEHIPLKDVASKHIPPNEAAAQLAKADNTAKEPLPLLQAATVEKIVDVWLKTVDVSKKEVVRPDKLPSLEAKLPKFHMQIGLGSLDETLHWPLSVLKSLGEFDIFSLAILAKDYKNEIIQLRQELDAAMSLLVENKIVQKAS